MNLIYKFKKLINNRILRTPGVTFLKKTSSLKKKKKTYKFLD